MTTPTINKVNGPARRPGANGDMSALIPTVNIAAGVSAQDAMAGGATVATPTEQRPTENGVSNPRETATNTKRHTTVILCDNCGREFTPRRPHGRFCSAYCRRVAWLGRNPEKAAELAERDRARLRAHVIGGGGDWREDTRVDRCHNGE